MKKFDKNISVVFPAYNEEENIEVCIIIARAVLKELVNNFESIMVDDGSADDTKKTCQQLERRFPEVKIISKAPSKKLIKENITWIESKGFRKTFYVKRPEIGFEGFLC